VVGLKGQADRCAVINSDVGLADLTHLQYRFFADPCYHRYCSRGNDTCELGEKDKYALGVLHAF
jgi:hypothetical protein